MGIPNPFDVENRFWQFLNKVADLFVLTIIQFVCSIPVVTAGAANAGFCHAAGNVIDNRGKTIVRDFFTGFKKRFVFCTIYWVLQLATSALLCFDMWICLNMMTKFGNVVMSVNAVLLLCVTIVSFYVYPVAIGYEFPISKILKDSCVIAVSHLFHSLAFIFLIVLCIFIGIRIHWFFIFVPLILESYTVIICRWIFRNYEEPVEKFHS